SRICAVVYGHARRCAASEFCACGTQTRSRGSEILGGSPADEEIFPAGAFARTSGIPARRGSRRVFPVVRTSVPISPASAIDLGVRLDLNPEERHPHPFPYLVDHVLCLVTRYLDQDFVVNHADDVGQ